MPTLLFVHGTGVRETAFESTLNMIRDRLGARAPQVDVRGCYWGYLGARLNDGGASIPLYDTARGFAQPLAITEDDAASIALWSLLADDPFFELRLLALRESEGGELPPGSFPLGMQLEEAIEGMRAVARARDEFLALHDLLERHAMLDSFDAACEAVASSEPCGDLIRRANGDLNEYHWGLARAIVAMAMILTTEEHEGWRLDGLTREALADMVARRLGVPGNVGDTGRGIGGWVLRQIAGIGAGIAKRLVTNHMKRKRGAISDAAYPAAGDILHYQTHGADIRGCIRRAIMHAGGPVTVVAHSLGGIACVDLLMEEKLDVHRLITVGSQAPFMYEIDALGSLRHAPPPLDDRLPPHFPLWTNIYDLRDILSYLAAGVFGSRVEDLEVDNGKPFPDSHSGYWDNLSMWDKIIERLP